MGKSKKKLEALTFSQNEKITATAGRKKRVPLIASKQVNMRLDPGMREKVKKLAAAQGLQYTTFLARGLKSFKEFFDLGFN